MLILVVAVLQKDLNARVAELAGYRDTYQKEQLLFDRIKAQQKIIINEIAKQSVSRVITSADKSQCTIPIFENGSVYIFNDVSSQRISFGTGILFDKESSSLSFKGEQLIKLVGDAFLLQSENIHEIQIAGHADTSGEENFNLHLAGERAMSVLQYLQDHSGIDPAEKIMSATSYGEFMPVKRPYHEKHYSQQRLALDNQLLADQDRNRRIEIVLKFDTSNK